MAHARRADRRRRGLHGLPREAVPAAAAVVAAGDNVRVDGGVDMVDVEGVLVHELDMMLVPAEFMLSKESLKLFSSTFVKKLEFMSSSTLSA